MLTPQLYSELIRQRLGEPDGSNAARYINSIPEVLKAVGRKVAANPALRQLLTTDKSVVQYALTNNALDLTNLYDTYNVFNEYLDYGQIYRFLFYVATVDTGNDRITIADCEFVEGERVRWTSTGTLPAPIVAGTDYFINIISAVDGLYKVYTNQYDNTTLVNFTTTGTGVHTITSHDPSGYPLQKRMPHQRNFANQYDDDLFYYIVEKDVLSVLPLMPNSKLGFAVPYFAANLSQLPDSEELENMTLAKGVEFALITGDVAEDGEK